jgi:hypothetical protein
MKKRKENEEEEDTGKPVHMEVKYDKNGKAGGRDATFNGDELGNGGHELCMHLLI